MFPPNFNSPPCNGDPVALTFGTCPSPLVRADVFTGFAAAYALAWYRTKSRPDWNADMVADLVF